LNMKKSSDFGKELKIVIREMDLLEERVRMEQGASKKSYDYTKQHLNKLWEIHNNHEERLNDMELQINLLTRLITTLCLEKLGYRLSEFRKLIRRTEKELADDSEIAHLESLFSLESRSDADLSISSKKTIVKKKPRRRPGRSSGNSGK